MSDSLEAPLTVTCLTPSVHGISQTRILEWVAIPFLGDLPDPEIKPMSPALSSGFFYH